MRSRPSSIKKSGYPFFSYRFCSGSWIRRILFLFFFFACATFQTRTPLHAQTKPPAPTEYQVKAAFLYHFASFVEWPSEAFTHSNELLICVMGQDPFGAFLDQAISGKVVQGKKLSALRLEKNGPVNGCHILFISSSEKDRLKEIREAIKRTPILTVGDVDQFAQIGFAINFVSDQNKIRFEINPNAVERAGLKVSAQLMKLAIIVLEKL
jgi:hypothetical protein